MSAKVMHIFYDTWLGFGHASLMEIFEQQTGKSKIEMGEVAVFVNKSKCSAKIMAAGGVMLYYKSSLPITPDTLRRIPEAVGGEPFQISAKLTQQLAKDIADKLGAKVERMRVRWSGTMAAAT